MTQPLAAVVVLAVTAGTDDLDGCLTHVVAAADEAAAARSLPVLVAVAPAGPGDPGADLVARWRSLTAPLDAVTVLPVPVPGAGARRHATAAALAHPALEGLAAERVLLLTTDSRASVGLDWVLGHAGHVRAGAAGATARVVPGPGGTAGAHEPGLNMAVRADAYLAAGGFPAADGEEDRALWGALHERGLHLVHALEPAVALARAGQRTGGGPRWPVSQRGPHPADG